MEVAQPVQDLHVPLGRLLGLDLGELAPRGGVHPLRQVAALEEGHDDVAQVLPASHPRVHEADHRGPLQLPEEVGLEVRTQGVPLLQTLGVDLLQREDLPVPDAHSPVDDPVGPAPHHHREQVLVRTVASQRLPDHLAEALQRQRVQQVVVDALDSEVLADLGFARREEGPPDLLELLGLAGERDMEAGLAPLGGQLALQALDSEEHHPRQLRRPAVAPVAVLAGAGPGAPHAEAGAARVGPREGVVARGGEEEPRTEPPPGLLVLQCRGRLARVQLHHGQGCGRRLLLERGGRPADGLEDAARKLEDLAKLLQLIPEPVTRLHDDHFDALAPLVLGQLARDDLVEAPQEFLLLGADLVHDTERLLRGLELRGEGVQQGALLRQQVPLPLVLRPEALGPELDPHLVLAPLGLGQVHHVRLHALPLAPLPQQHGVARGVVRGCPVREHGIADAGDAVLIRHPDADPSLRLRRRHARDTGIRRQANLHHHPSRRGCALHRSVALRTPSAHAGEWGEACVRRREVHEELQERGRRDFDSGLAW
mmetsp:Transcript_23440/g.65637  ORF Transcript_23440/g.65637 Transcript_23440/m.65637 type:complete len:540 (+) Transcript_23440:741-2360(+)